MNLAIWLLLLGVRTRLDDSAIVICLVVCATACDRLDIPCAIVDDTRLILFQLSQGSLNFLQKLCVCDDVVCLEY